MTPSEIPAWVIVLVTAINAIPPTVAAMIAYRKVKKRIETPDGSARIGQAVWELRNDVEALGEVFHDHIHDRRTHTREPHDYLGIERRRRYWERRFERDA